MAIQSSFPTVAEQVLTLNKNVVDLLTKINNVTTSTDASISVQIYDERGVLRNFNLPTLNSLKTEIERLSNNMKSIYNIDGNGSMIQIAPGIFRKVVSVDLNREPVKVNDLGSVTRFVASNNWFFDSMVNPMMSVEFDLTGQIDNSVRKVQARRYIVEFEKDATGALTPAGQSALNSFNAAYRDNSQISITDFEAWHRTTPGVVNGTNPKIDDQQFELEPNELATQGLFTPVRTMEDRINKKLWYYLDTIEYLNNVTGKAEKLSIGMELMVNASVSTTRYRVSEINTNDALPRVRFDRIEGNDPIPVGAVGSLKVYSEIIRSKSVRISIGYDERNVVFMKPIDQDSHVMASEWSQGTGFYTNLLSLSSETTSNGVSMEQFYTDFVYDYGTALKDMVVKKIPTVLGATPPAPTLVASNFKVVQINKHITDTPDSKLLKQKHNYQSTLKSEVQQLQEAIYSRNRKAKTERYASDSDRKKAQLEIEELTKKRDSKSKLLSTVTQEILDLSKNPMSNIGPKFAVRGFVTIPDPVLTNGTKAQEIVQFKVQYKYLSKSGQENQVQTYSIDDTQNTGAISNWIEFMTPARQRLFNPATGGYTWESQDVSNADVPNMNQIDISIQPNEKIQFRVMSVSEAGWPESPVMSTWSEVVEVEFPTDLNNVLNENETIKNEANKEDLKSNVINELAAKGLDQHLSETTVVGDRTYLHESDSILSGFKDASGVNISLFEYLRSLQDRIKSLEEKILRAKGELLVKVFRDTEATEIKDGDTIVYGIECEEYLTKYLDTRLKSTRVYENSIYKIDSFRIEIKNNSKDSPLGLISSFSYTDTDVYAPSLPQVFWVDKNDNLITVDSTTNTKTQMDNQFVWSVNYESSASSTQNRLADNIGNSFAESNSLIRVLSTTQYNLGYGESTKISFKSGNKSLTDPEKWTDPTRSADAASAFLTTVHPVVTKLEDVVETNSEKTRTLAANETVQIPLRIFFKMNAQDNTTESDGSKYIDLNNSRDTKKHSKKVRFILKNEADNRSFRFTIQFDMNRVKIANSSNSSSTSYTVKNNSSKK